MDIVKLLTEKNLKIATAESCTGGLIAKLITDRAGASMCFECGFVTYSNEIKIRVLGVDAEIIEKYGAVSSQTAKQMCEGARLKSGADIALSVTGIAAHPGAVRKSRLDSCISGYAVISARIRKNTCFRVHGTKSEAKRRKKQYKSYMIILCNIIIDISGKLKYSLIDIIFLENSQPCFHGAKASYQ